MDQLVGSNTRHLLSAYVGGWYRSIVSGDFFDAQFRHPHFELKAYRSSHECWVPEKTISCVTDGRIVLDTPNTIWVSDATPQLWLDPLKNLALSRYLQDMPFMTSSDVLLGEGKLCKLMTFDEVQWYCAVELKDPEQYVKSLDAIKSVTADFNDQVEGGLTIQVSDSWAVILDGGKAYFVTPFYGQTLAQRWRDLSAEKRKRLLDLLRDLLLFFEKRGLYWRDFAPRNMLSLTDDSIVLIDFEHLVDIRAIPQSERVVLDRYRRIWFGDMLSQLEIDYLFEPMPVYVSDGAARCATDQLEATYFGKTEISFAERLGLLDMISNVERVHSYNGINIYGHRMGLYMSDFLSVASEATLYKILDRLPLPTWPILLQALQQTIDFDQLNYIMNLYNKGVVTKKTEAFLKDMDSVKLSTSSLEYEVTQWTQRLRKQHGAASN